MAPRPAGDSRFVRDSLSTPRRIAAEVKVAVVDAGVAGSPLRTVFDSWCNIVSGGRAARGGTRLHSSHRWPPVRVCVVCDGRELATSSSNLRARTRRRAPAVHDVVLGSLRSLRPRVPSATDSKSLFAERRRRRAPLVRPAAARQPRPVLPQCHARCSTIPAPTTSRSAETLRERRLRHELQADGFLRRRSPPRANVVAERPRIRSLTTDSVHFFNNHSSSSACATRGMVHDQGGSQRYVTRSSGACAAASSWGAPVRGIQRDDAGRRGPASNGLPG